MCAARTEMFLDFKEFVLICVKVRCRDVLNSVSVFFLNFLQCYISVYDGK